MVSEEAALELRIRALNAEKRAELIRALIADLMGPEGGGGEQAWRWKVSPHRFPYTLFRFASSKVL